MTWVFLEAEDVWLFRDGRPFSAGEEHAAQSVFPPSPLTVQGVLRSHIGALQGVFWEEYRDQSTPRARQVAALIGEPPTLHSAGTLGQFAMAGPYVARCEDGTYYRYLPLPADVAALEQGMAILAPQDKDITANWPAEGLLPAWTDLEDVDDKLTRDVWLREDAFADYLKGTPPNREDKGRWVKGSSLYQTEHRFGIAIDAQIGRTREGMLYQAAFIRPCRGVGLLVWLSDEIALGERGFLAMGGERRGARYETLAEEAIFATQQEWPSASGPRLKLVFLTPAYFSGGWQPTGGDWAPFFAGAQPYLAAAALQRPIAIGGWDLAAQQPRAIHHYVAPGSVLYFEADGDFHLNAWAVTETPPGLPDAARMGFGQVAVGVW